MTKEELKPIDTSKYKITETGQVLKMTKDRMNLNDYETTLNGQPVVYSDSIDRGIYKRGEKMTKEEIKQKTSLCFLLNPNISEEEKNYVIERVMATKATIVSKAALCNIITYILKQNAKLQEKLNIRSCQNCKHNNK